MTKRLTFQPLGAVLRRIACRLAAERNSAGSNSAPGASDGDTTERRTAESETPSCMPRRSKNDVAPLIQEGPDQRRHPASAEGERKALSRMGIEIVTKHPRIGRGGEAMPIALRAHGVASLFNSERAALNLRRQSGSWSRRFNAVRKPSLTVV